MYERHEGDNLLSNDPRLKCKWKWSRVASRCTEEELRKWTHFQVSFAEIGDWTLETIQWGAEPVYYESSVEYGGDRITSVGHNRKTGTQTRIEAQIRAERLLMEWITKEYKFITSKLG